MASPLSYSLEQMQLSRKSRAIEGKQSASSTDTLDTFDTEAKCEM